ncbi:MAG: tetratricopeptide repeat protein [Candidatus Omnitrophota bacterium]|nr:tetratricopeptide repeat protein [Candidatus Omnitrophota bacterium]
MSRGTLYALTITALVVIIPVIRLDAANRESPSRAQVLKLYFEGDPTAHEDLFRSYLADHPEDNEIWGLLGSALAAQGRYEDGEEIYRKLLERAPDNVSAKRELVSTLIYQGKMSDAYALNEELLETLGDSWTDIYTKANLLMFERKLVRAQVELEKLIKLQPNLLKPRTELCGIYLTLGEYKKCGPVILDYGVDDIEDVEYCILRATYHMKRMNYDEAGVWIEKALSLVPGHPEIVTMQYVNDVHLGRVLLGEVRRREDGIKSSLREHYRRTALMMEAGNFLQAKEKLRWLMHYYPDDLELQLSIALIDGELGELDKAIDAIEEITHVKTDKITVVETAQQAYKDYVRQREFERKTKTGEWKDAEVLESRYFKLKTNVGDPYRTEFLASLDEYVDDLTKILTPIFGEKVIAQPKADLNIYADKISFVRDSYDYYFSDAVFFSGVFVREKNTLYYHFTEELKTGGIIHEIAHWVMADLMIRAPAWLDEGVADYVSMKLSGIDFLENRLAGKTYMSELYRFGKLPDLDRVIKTRDYQPRSYVLWRNAAQFFFEYENGKYIPRLRKYIEMLTNESFSVDAFGEAFEDVMEELNEDWVEFARQKVRL